ncbi:MAG TPA: DUF308 domain-containing protein [candidate division Zixibacteria bacterium]|nr:DUF308 domain-containing protein [candidate division Zixibacteria bacterium]
MGLHFAATIMLARAWWAFILQGVLAVLFGVVILLYPGIGASALILLFGAWMLADGITDLARAWRTRGQRNWWVSVLEGLAGVVVGLIAVLLPGITLLSLVLLVGAWAIATGALEVYLAIRLREEISGELWMAVAGIASILLGILIIAFGPEPLLWLIAVFVLAFGFSLIALGWRLRGIHQQATRQNEYVERGR